MKSVHHKVQPDNTASIQSIMGERSTSIMGERSTKYAITHIIEAYQITLNEQPVAELSPKQSKAFLNSAIRMATRMLTYRDMIKSSL